MSGICTHLGCTVHRDQKNDLYHCPCHGSRFNPKGEVLDGPAPKNLPWLAVNLSPDGTLLIHPSRHVSQDFKITI
jgi:cytochrome b6-f complex iron-sulfur subunit